jgi:PAS domain S-box-containing protein
MLSGDNGFRAIFHNPFLGNILLDNQMRVVLFNEEAKKVIQQFFGLEIAEGTSFLRYAATDEQRELLILNFQKALQGLSTRFEIKLTNLTGNTQWFLAMYIPIHNDAGEVNWICFSYYDINELHQQTLTIDKQRRELAKSETIFKALFENQPYANIFISPEGRLLAINQKASTLFRKFNLSISQETTDIFIALKQSSVKDIAELAQNVLQNSTAVVLEKELLDTAGKKYWMELHLMPIVHSDGEIFGVHIQMKDNSRQKKTEELMRLQQERLRHSESQLRALFDSSSDINIFVGPDYRIISFNKQAVDTVLQQLQKRLLSGLDIHTIVVEERQQSFEQNFQAALNGQTTTVEVALPNYMGVYNWYRFSYTPVIDRFGNTIGVIINAININEHKQNEEKILQQNEQIKEFAFLTAHRLRAPVASILGLIKIFDLDSNMNSDDVHEIIRRLRIATEELNYAVSEMNRSLEPLQINQSTENQMSSVSVINNTARPASIVLIDDDPIVNMVSKTLLQRNYPGIVIHAFLKAEEALQFLKTSKEQPSLILLDVVMPEMNGWQFLNEFQKLPLQPPVCMLSSSLRKSDHEEAKNYPSVVDFIIKPLDAEKIKVVMQFLKASQ